MNKLKKILCIVLALVLAFSVKPMDAEAASKKAIVSTQKKLETALKDKNITKITIKTKKTISLNIKNGSYAKKAIVIDAPKAAITNKGIFKKISITDAKTFTEKASGNQIAVTDSKLKLVIDKNSAKDKLIFDRKASDITLVLNGTPAGITNKKDAKLNITNNTEKDVVITGSDGKETIIKPSNAASSDENNSKPDAVQPDDSNNSDNNSDNSGGNSNSSQGNSDNNSSSSNSGSSSKEETTAEPSTEFPKLVAAEMIISHILYQDGKLVDVTAIHGNEVYHMNTFSYDIKDSFEVKDIVKMYLAVRSSGITVHKIEPAEDDNILPGQTIDVQTVNPGTGTFSANGTEYTLSSAVDTTIAKVVKSSSGGITVTPITVSDLALLSENNQVTISFLGGTGYVQSILVTVE